MNLKLYIIVILLATNTLYAELMDESIEDLLEMKTELKAEIGSRSGSRDLLVSKSPTDVITSEDIERSGQTSLVDLLRYSVAGFNAPETSIADISDHIRAYTLRGMNPDQILVLINGKRLHTSALLHINGTIGRGTSNVDLDTIALNSVEKIEILRDGAAAQYGSDAIAGVINIILKGVGHKNSLSLHSGQRKVGDGEQVYADGYLSFPLKYDGFVNLTLSAKTQKETGRGGLDQRVAPLSVTSHVGIPKTDSFNVMLNIEAPQVNDTIFYTNGLFNHRDSEASTFFRPASHNENTTLIYPNGFLPMLGAEIDDYSFVFGIKGEVYGFKYDLSNIYGKNEININLDNSMNYTLGALSPTSFYNGTLGFTQNTTNLDLKKKYDKFDIASGIEYRYENYTLEAGDLNSYIGTASQGFAGYKPENETNSKRRSYALYFDTTYNFSEEFSLEGAARFEDYSDFGTTSNYKVSLAYKVLTSLLFRSTLSTGFRAPSLSQSNYSQTSSFVDGNNNLVSQSTYKPDHELSASFGARALEPEESKHLSLGTVYSPTKNISLMLDYYLTKVDHRITISEEFTPKNEEQIALFALYDTSRISFFTNALNTKTEGLDLKFNYKYEISDNSTIDTSIWFNYNKNIVTSFNKKTSDHANKIPSQLDRIENGQPKTSLKLLTKYEINDLHFNLNINRFGSYREARNNIAYNFDAKWTTDLDISYDFENGINLAVGGLNIFDSIADKWEGLTGTFYGSDGIKPYSRYSPFGYSGAYYYIRATVKF